MEPSYWQIDLKALKNLLLLIQQVINIFHFMTLSKVTIQINKGASELKTVLSI